MKKNQVKVIFDTNIWISFLIGKRLSQIKKYIIDGRIKIVFCEQLLDEIETVTSRQKLKKYFPQESVKELIDLLEAIGQNVEIRSKKYHKQRSER